MAKPDTENGHIDIAHDLAEALMRVNLSGYQNRIIWCIFRKTYGWHKSTDKISLTLFEKMTGMERRNINRTIKELEDMNMVIVDRNNRVNTYKFNSDYDTWKIIDSVNIDTSVKRDTKVVSKETPKLVSKETHTKEKKETIQKKESLIIFDYWNEEKIIIHRKLDQATESSINARLKDNSVDEIRDSIHYYSIILKDDDYRWNYAWTLKDFMQKGFELFRDWDIAHKNYYIGKEKYNGYHG
ncbi:hypothetical protein ES707_20240 [subsurface metagenome]